jgi:hypothetical protein
MTLLAKRVAAIQQNRWHEQASQIARRGKQFMKSHRKWHLSLLTLLAALLLSPVSRGQVASSDAKGVDSGNYNIQQTLEFGYRANWVNGSQDAYDTFVNLGPGVRLFNYTLDMRSLDHQGLLFDNLSFSNFGYGGDPDDVSRLHIDKNKWYDFQLLFRRDKNFWDYNLFANPLNPASSNPAIPSTSSPQAMDLVRRMQDYNLTLLPQSRVRFRLGYSRNVDEGPALQSYDSGVLPQFTTAFRTTQNDYHVGIDFRLLPKTTLSYDQFLDYFREDNATADQNLSYLLPGSVPVDLGIVWNTAGNTPCGTPFPSTTPGFANPGCNGILSYSAVGRPRTFMPTERFSFQSTYFKNLEMSGSIGYSTSDNTIADFNEVLTGLTTRTDTRGSTTSGPAEAKRVSVDADGSAIYSVTERLRILDNFRYDNWRIPGLWNAVLGNQFSTAGAGFPSMLLPIVQFTPATFSAICPAPYNAATCPQHASGSGPDIETEMNSQFLGQNLKQNTIQAEYDFTPKLSGHIGYRYTNRKIANFSSSLDTGEIYFPGGPTATAANDYLAARGDCAFPAAPAPHVLPAKCTLQADGSIIATGLDAGSDTSRNVIDINEQAALIGLTARPMDSLRVTGDFEFGYNDYAFTRTSPRQMQSYRIHANYTPRQWVNLDGAIDIEENRDNVYQVNNLEHDRTYSFVVVLSPASKFSFDIGYSYTNVYSQADICFAASGPGVPAYPACPANLGSPVPLTALSFYTSAQHFAYSDLMWKPIKRFTATLGYASTFVGGNTLFLSPLQPAGTLVFNYQKPYAMFQFDLYKGISYKTAWNYYGYNGKGPTAVSGLAPLGSQDFNGSTATFSFLYSF